MTRAMIARVEPLTTARALRGPFDYRLPDEMGDVGVGTLLEVPFGPRRILGVVVDLAAESELPPERLAEPIAALEAGATPELVRLGLWVAERYCSTPARGLALVLPPGSGTGSRGRAAVLRPRTEGWANITGAGREAIAPQAAGRRLGERQRAALELLAAAGELSVADLAEAGADAGVLARLEARGLLVRERREVRRRPAIARVGAVRDEVTLSPRQRDCAAAVVASIEGTAPREHLLHGVTGSGKTEVYLAAIEAAIARGRGAILLVPEIGLTPQTLGRVAARLGDTVAVLHSALSEGERLDEWRRLRSGEARVCVGPRSAVLAPVADLGLIVVDEEHDPSYKQEGDPRYDARAVARHRAGCAGAAYLAWLGCQTLWAAWRGSPSARPSGVTGLSGARSFRQGLVSNLGNPKMALFFTSLLPQFAPASGPAFPWLLVLGLLFCGLTLAWLAAYAVAVARAGDVLRRPRVRRAIDSLTGTVLVALGLRLAAEHG